MNELYKYIINIILYEPLIKGKTEAGNFTRYRGIKKGNTEQKHKGKRKKQKEHQGLLTHQMLANFWHSYDSHWNVVITYDDN